MSYLHTCLGFNSHPFVKTNADEEPYLAEYFVSPPFYDGVIGDPSTPSSSVVLAPRGGGKTALRRMLENTSLSKNYLAVTYDRFEFSKGFKLSDVTLQYHLKNIITRILVVYVSHLVVNPGLISQLSADSKKRLSVYVHSYLGNMNGDNMQVILKELKGLPEKFKDFWREKVGLLESIVNFLLKSYDLDEVDLPEIEHERRSLAQTYKYQLEYLAELAGQLGFNSVYVLIDKPDETELTGNDAAATYALIKPLIRDLELLGLTGFGFKFFLWEQVEEYYRNDARPDRTAEFQLSWSRGRLELMLSKRLNYHSDGRISSWKEISNVDKLGYDPDEMICLFANRSPRNAIRIGEKVFSAQAEKNPMASEIEPEAFEAGIMAYCEQLVKDMYPADTIKVLQRGGRVLFTINYLTSNVFKTEVHANSVRNKVSGWVKSGAVMSIGTVSVETSKKPLNFYYVCDPAIVRLIYRNSSIKNFLDDFWIPCGFCEVDNLIDIELYPEGNPPLCTSCGRDMF